ncbi:hypothetical protein BH09PLA1_BH09PLA1_18240 [soil metagenome]
MLDLLTVGGSESGWMPSELGAILSHQLDVPLAETAADDSASDVVDGKLDPEWRGATLRALLVHPAPPIALLSRLKQFFKLASTAPGDSLPKEVATVLYIAVIVAGQRAGERLTRLDDASIQERVEWASRRRWLDPSLASLFKNFRAEPNSS